MAASQGEAKLMVSYGGKIERGSGDSSEARYVGGENLLVSVSRSATLRGFRARLAARAGFSSFSVKYGISGESLDALRDVACEAELRDLLDKVLCRDLSIRLFRDKPAPRRVRVFLFRAEAAATSKAKASHALPPAIMRRSPTAPGLLSAEQSKKPAQPPADQAKANKYKAVLPAAPVRRVATAPASLADAMPSGLPPRPPKRQIASAPPSSATARPKDDDTPASSSSSTVSTTSAVAGTSVSSTGRDSGRNAQAASRLAEQTRRRTLVCPAPVFLLPVVPVIVYQPVIILVPAFSCNVVQGSSLC